MRRFANFLRRPRCWAAERHNRTWFDTAAVRGGITQNSLRGVGSFELQAKSLVRRVDIALQADERMSRAQPVEGRATDGSSGFGSVGPIDRASQDSEAPPDCKPPGEIASFNCHVDATHKVSYLEGNERSMTCSPSPERTHDVA